MATSLCLVARCLVFAQSGQHVWLGLRVSATINTKDIDKVRGSRLEISSPTTHGGSSTERWSRNTLRVVTARVFYVLRGFLTSPFILNNSLRGSNLRPLAPSAECLTARPPELTEVEETCPLSYIAPYSARSCSKALYNISIADSDLFPPSTYLNSLGADNACCHYYRRRTLLKHIAIASWMVVIFYGWVNRSPHDRIAAHGASNPLPFGYEFYALTNCAITTRLERRGPPAP